MVFKGILLKVLYVILIFIAGFSFAQFWDPSLGFNRLTGFTINSPSDFINNDNILIYPDKIIIKVENARLDYYDSSGSMTPVLGNGANGITIKPKSTDDINIGDIITFRQGNELIAHRVIDKDFDKNGVYFITKGDNNNFVDGKIRFDEIEGVLIGLVY